MTFPQSIRSPPSPARDRSRAGRLAIATIAAIAVTSAIPAVSEAAHRFTHAERMMPSNNVVVAEAGSMGGTVAPAIASGKHGKSLSGGENPAVRPPTRRAQKPRESRPRAAARSPRCPNIVGVWDSWASGLFGRSDTTVNNDGSAIHRSGIRGRWWCESGQLMMSWGSQPAKVFTLSSDRRRISGPDGRVGFSRGDRNGRVQPD